MVRTPWQSTNYEPFSLARNLKDVTDPDLQVRKALAARIRDACINVGFFYGSAFNNTLPMEALQVWGT